MVNRKEYGITSIHFSNFQAPFFPSCPIWGLLVPVLALMVGIRSRNFTVFCRVAGFGKVYVLYVLVKIFFFYP